MDEQRNKKTKKFNVGALSKRCLLLINAATSRINDIPFSKENKNYVYIRTIVPLLLLLLLLLLRCKHSGGTNGIREFRGDSSLFFGLFLLAPKSLPLNNHCCIRTRKNKTRKFFRGCCRSLLVMAM